MPVLSSWVSRPFQYGIATSLLAISFCLYIYKEFAYDDIVWRFLKLFDVGNESSPEGPQAPLSPGRPPKNSVAAPCSEILLIKVGSHLSQLSDSPGPPLTANEELSNGVGVNLLK